MEHKVIAVCGGNGSWLYPFKDYLIMNVEPRANFLTPKNVQWYANFWNVEISRTLPKFITPITAIVGAPNCGHSSMLALSNSVFRPADDDYSFQMYFKAVEENKPMVFVMENLPKSQPVVEKFAEKLGYFLISNVLPMSEFGNSQTTRKRYVAVGIRRNLDKKVFNKLNLIWGHIKSYNTLKTSGELINGLDGPENIPELGHFREGLDDMVTIYAGRKITLKEAKEYWDNDPKAKRFKAIDRKYDTAPGVYRNLSDEYPAVARKADRQFNHNGYQMSPRELARIQGIPDEFKLYFPKNPSDREIKYWINKGRTTATKCPPYEFGLWVKDRLSRMARIEVPV